MTFRTLTLGELCHEGGGGIQTGPFGSQLHAADYVTQGVPSVMPQNIGDNFINPVGIARITEADAERLSRYLLHEGDIVYARRGDVEKRALVRSENNGWLCGTGCLRVRPGSGAANDARFLSYALGTEEVRAWIVRHAVGATMPNLNTSILSAVPLRVPEPAVQRAIAAVLGALDDKIAANTDLISTAGSLAVSIAETFDDMTPLAEVVTHHKRMVSPESLADCLVEHYSLPACDASNAPEEVAPSMIKSGKFSVDQPCVLVSKLNPRFPRIWDVPAVGPTTALASTEFLVLASRYSASTVLWAVLSQPGFSASLESQVAGTSGSHQRVKPRDLLATEVIDPRLMCDSAKDAITSLGQNIASYRQESLKLAELRDAMLPELMSGRLRVKDAERIVEGEV